MAVDMTQRMLFFTGWLCLTLAGGPVAAQQEGPALEAALSKAYANWREAMIQKNPQAWAGAITTFRQTTIRNEIVSNKEAFPAAVFAAPGEPPKTDGMRLIEAEAKGTTAHLVYFGKIDGGKDTPDASEVLMKLKFGLEGGRWRYDSARVTDLDSSPEVLKALREGKKPDLLDAPEFTPPGKMPPAPPLCRVPDFKGGLKLQSTGYETQVLAASIRSANHVRDAALAGADCATIPVAVFKSLYKHHLTDAGLEAFAKDWKSTGQSIL